MLLRMCYVNFVLVSLLTVIFFGFTISSMLFGLYPFNDPDIWLCSAMYMVAILHNREISGPSNLLYIYMYMERILSPATGETFFPLTLKYNVADHV